MAEHTGGMVALVPTDADLARLAVPGGDPRDQLHLTLAYLGDDVTGWDDAARADLHAMARTVTGPITARAMGHAQFNPDHGPDGDRDPCMVYLVSDSDRLAPLREQFGAVAADAQHEPFLPHITAGYGLDPDALTYTGPITFDRIRVALADDVTDYPLAAETETDMADNPDGIPVTFPVLAVEGLPTADGRYIEPGSLTHRPLPLPVLAQTTTPVGGGGHDGASVIGRLDRMERVAGNTVVSKVTGAPFPDGTFVWVGYGHIDPAAPASDLARRGYLTGNSVDLSEVEAFLEQDPDYVALDNDDAVDGVRVGRGGERMRLTKGVISATTLVPIPAFADAYVMLDGQQVTRADGLVAAAVPSWRSAELGDLTCLPCAAGDDTGPAMLAALTASADTADLPPVAWFRDPELPAATPLTVGPDGRVYGHLAQWGTCHTSYAGQCVMAPRSTCDYAYFRTGAKRVMDDDGQPTQIGIGKLTVVLDTAADGHAGDKLGAMPAAAHYDNAACAVADVEIGEDAHGVWVAGALRPNATPEQVDALMGSTLSGDWRPINGRLELVAALGVNVGGFPIPRARVASGQILSLVAAGAVRRPVQLSDDQDALAQAIATRVLRQLGTQLPAEPVDTGTDDLAARRASALAAIAQAELADRRMGALDVFGWDEFTPDEVDVEFARKNWVSKAGGLPKYVKRIVKHLRAKGMTESHAIATAVNAAKKMCATGDVNFPGKQQVNPGSKAEACAAVADWERKKAQS